MKQLHVEILKESLRNIVASKISTKGREDKEDAFFISDLGDIVHKFELWQSELPRVKPHYAVKCNDDPAVLSVLASLGTGFDCASKAEIQKVLDLNVSSDRIIYANPCKQTSHIKFAAKNNVPLMTFDNEPELHKIKAVFPDAKLVLRIMPPDDSKSQCPLGMKFGCRIKEVQKLLKVARELALDVIGVSFHVGSGCYDPTAFSAAVALARTVFDMGKEQHFQFQLLDIGGGFPGQKSAKVSFEEICSELRPALDTYFPESSGVDIISEPGRFFVASAFTLAVNIIAKRLVVHDALPNFKEGTVDDNPAFMYYVNDGVYGSFCCLLYDHAEVTPTLLNNFNSGPQFESSIWGPTCDGLDCIRQNCLLPQLDTGDWIIFEDMGAYTLSAASNFNGMPKPRRFYVAEESHWDQISAFAVRRDVKQGTHFRGATEENALTYDRFTLADCHDSLACPEM